MSGCFYHHNRNDPGETVEEPVRLMVTEAGGRTLVMGNGEKLKPTLAGIDIVLKLTPGNGLPPSQIDR